jgi:hypothetical protein
METKQKTIASLDELHILVMEAVFPGYWGKGLTLDEALINSHKPKKYLALLVHKDTTVDPVDGRLWYPLPFVPRELFRRGVPKKKEVKSAAYKGQRVDGGGAVEENSSKQG